MLERTYDGIRDIFVVPFYLCLISIRTLDYKQTIPSSVLNTTLVCFVFLTSIQTWFVFPFFLLRTFVLCKLWYYAMRPGIRIPLMSGKMHQLFVITLVQQDTNLDTYMNRFQNRKQLFGCYQPYRLCWSSIFEQSLCIESNAQKMFWKFLSLHPPLIQNLFWFRIGFEIS